MGLSNVTYIKPQYLPSYPFSNENDSCKVCKIFKYSDSTKLPTQNVDIPIEVFYVQNGDLKFKINNDTIISLKISIKTE